MHLPDRIQRPRFLAVAALLAAGLSVATGVHSEGAAPARCGAILSPEDVMRHLNAARIRGAVCHGSAGLSTAAPLRWSSSLAEVAAAQADDMAAANRMSHRDSQNRNLAARLTAMGYRFSTAVENVAVGYPSLETVVEAWLASETHCANLMNTAVLEFGLACSDSATGGSAGKDRYWTLVLGAPPKPR
jgi:uncharacterized protein YkwD